MSRVWCCEESMSWFVASILRKAGMWLLLGLGDEKFIVLSKSELKVLESDLGPNYIQGRHRVDFAAYNDEKVVVGIVLSRIIPLTLRVSDECCKLAISMVLSEPRRCVSAYLELRKRGFGFASMNVAKMLKVVAGVRGSGRLKRVSGGKQCIGLAVVLDVGPAKRYAVEELKMLRDYVAKRGWEVELSLYAFKPLEISSQPPAMVSVEHVWGTKVVESGKMSFVETMGLDWLGCKKCRYLDVCASRFGG